ncbi:MAG: NAD-dependent epimerase/dehydratase family protein [Candidatus Abyssobacteria bacterium SURF_17]|uniref:NAD-dependent epimerase/dehydratase family protein n=1 Tax=Candidatus Abyssobacteria bacterium SURF_17 TaxID=2093361 RepID=A0A419ES92_9BACT|nr:MAG: NAD-dependent epimerase/dehydratase family protein [Candidatus Abyssubacteria bacterium SURF_17]
MKVLVTGGSGYIGSAVIRELLEKKQKVRVLVRKSDDLRNLEGLDAELFYGDITDFHSLLSALEGCDRVFHLAAIYAIWLPDPRMMYWVNVQGTKNVFEACLQSKIKKVVYTSSVAALGAHGKERPADETAQFNLWHTKDKYYISKFRAEQVALDYFKRGLPVVIVNPTNPCGPRDIMPTPNGQLIINIIKGKLPGYVDGGINVSDISDTAKGHVLAMEKGKPGEKYVLGNTNVSVKEYFDLIAQIGGGKSPSMRIPKPVATFSGYLYQLLAEITKKPPVTTAAWVRVGSEYSFWNSMKAVIELGMPQTPIRESIENAIDWFRENGYL